MDLIRRLTDGVPVNHTTFTLDPVLRRALAIDEALYFEWWVTYLAGFNCAVKMGLVFPPGAAYWFGTHSNVKAAPNQTAVRNVAATSEADYFEFSGEGAVLMVATMVGVVTNRNTPGDMQLRFAQYVSNPSENVIIKANSVLRVWPL